MKKIHYIHHTHWDREWYRSAEAFRVRLISTIDLLIDTLEKNQDLSYYVLDGQVAILEDYLKVKPYNFNKIEALIKNKRLLIGPWYIQPDMFLVSSESLIRNVQIGMNYALSNFGDVMRCGWIPDAFGQISQTPQIFKKFGFDTVYSWRGFSNTDTKYNYFNWESPSKDKLLNIHFYLGYGFFRYLNENEIKAKEELLTNVEKFVDRCFSDNILFTGGSDHASVQTNLTQILEKVNPLLKKEGYEVKISNPLILKDEILNYVKENNFDIETFKGEAKSPMMGRIHAGIASTRQDLKKLSKFYENLLVDIIEPLNVITKNLSMPSNFELCLLAWKYLLQNQFHDSIYLSSPQQVNLSVENRYLEIKQLTYELIFEALRYTRDRIKVKKDHYPVVIFNTLPFIRSGYVYLKIPRKFKDFTLYDQNSNIVNYEFVKDYEFDEMSKDFLGILDLNSLSYSKQNHKNDMHYDVICFEIENMCSNGYVIYSYKNERFLNKKQTNLEVTTKKLKNKFLEVDFNNDGTINIVNLKTKQVFKNCLTIVNKGDEGDEYNYSWPNQDKIFTNKDVQNVKTKVIFQNSLFAKYEISYDLFLPKNITLSKRSEQLVKNKIKIILTLFENSSTLNVDFKFDNKSQDQIMIVKIPNINKNKTHFAGDDFYFIERDNEIDYAKNWKELKLSEIPLPMYSFKNILHFDCLNNSSLNVFTSSLTEYEIKNTDLDLTLYRSVSHLGKQNLQTRPGRASGYELETKSSQMQFEFDLNLKLNFGSNNHNQIFNDYKNEYSEFLSVAHRLTNEDKEEWFWENRYFSDIEHQMLSTQQFFEIDSSKIAFSALMEDFDKNGDVLRLFNANAEDVYNVCIKLNDNNIKKASLANLDGKFLKTLKIENNNVILKCVKKYEFISIKFER